MNVYVLRQASKQAYQGISDDDEYFRIVKIYMETNSLYVLSPLVS